MARKTKRSKVGVVVLCVLLVLVIIAAVVIGTHWDLIQAAKMGLTMDREQIIAEQAEKDKEIEAKLGVEGMITDEMIAEAEAEIEASLSGTADPGESGQTPSETGQAGSGSAGQNNGGASGGGNSGTAAATASDIVAKYTAKLYGARSVFEGKLNALVASAKAEYAALPAEQRTDAAKKSIYSSMLSSAGAIESECDATVESLLAQMSAELSAAGESTAPVDQLRSYYQEAKTNQKAYYLSMMRGQ